jgi:HPt (histidine-containing phosphotransfer) domain-containing protein
MSGFFPGGDLVLASPQLQQKLAAAAISDLKDLSQALILAWAKQDRSAIRRARHSLSGLCRVIGADDLEQAALGSLAQEAEIDRFTALLEGVCDALHGLAETGKVEVEHVR